MLARRFPKFGVKEELLKYKWFTCHKIAKLNNSIVMDLENHVSSIINSVVVCRKSSYIAS